jgi:hypothetical protein
VVRATHSIFPLGVVSHDLSPTSKDCISEEMVRCGCLIGLVLILLLPVGAAGQEPLTLERAPLLLSRMTVPITYFLTHRGRAPATANPVAAA